MLQMKWNINEEGRLSANWVKKDDVPDYSQDDQELLEELRLFYKLSSALDAVFVEQRR